MLNPIVHIAFTDLANGKYLEFDFVNSIEIEKSRKNLTAMCKINLPRKFKVLDGDINTILKRGTKVVVKMGYAPDLKTEFTGYIARVGAKIPVEIFCEDEMWNLKQNSFTKAWKNVSLAELVSFIYKGKTRLAKLQLGGFVIKNKSTSQVLEELKKHALQCYFDSEGTLVADFAGSTKDKPVEVGYDFNINIIENDLEYKTKEDTKIGCKGISKLENGKKIEFFYGDKDGDLRTLNFVNLNRNDLEKRVKNEIDQLKYNGYTNGFTSFGAPYCEPGYAAILSDEKYPERNGSYLVEGVSINFGVGGFRRKIKLERKLA